MSATTEKEIGSRSRDDAYEDRRALARKVKERPDRECDGNASVGSIDSGVSTIRTAVGDLLEWDDEKRAHRTYNLRSVRVKLSKSYSGNEICIIPLLHSRPSSSIVSRRRRHLPSAVDKS